MQQTNAKILLAKDYRHPDPISDEEFERGKAPWFFMSLEGTMVRCSELFPISSPPCCFCHEDPTGWWISEKLDGVRAVWRNGEFCSRGDNTFAARRAHCDPHWVHWEGERETEREREGELDTQDRIPNKWKELFRNKFVKSLSEAAEKYFRVHMRRYMKIPKKPANCHWDLWWFWPSNNFELKFAILVPVTLWAVLNFTYLYLFFESLYNTERDALSCLCGHAGRRTWKWKWCARLISVDQCWSCLQLAPSLQGPCRHAQNGSSVRCLLDVFWTASSGAVEVSFRKPPSSQGRAGAGMPKTKIRQLFGFLVERRRKA